MIPKQASINAFYVLLFNAGERRQLSEDLCGGKDSAFL
jgi:hypothetical protein